MTLSGCVTSGTGTASEYCLIAKPISFSTSRDTAETVAEIESHNLTWQAVCGAD